MSITKGQLQSILISRTSTSGFIKKFDIGDTSPDKFHVVISPNGVTGRQIVTRLSPVLQSKGLKFRFNVSRREVFLIVWKNGEAMAESSLRGVLRKLREAQEPQGEEPQEPAPYASIDDIAKRYGEEKVVAFIRNRHCSRVGYDYDLDSALDLNWQYNAGKNEDPEQDIVDDWISVERNGDLGQYTRR